jgi:hypothetical protein
MYSWGEGLYPDFAQPKIAFEVGGGNLLGTVSPPKNEKSRPVEEGGGNLLRGIPVSGHDSQRKCPDMPENWNLSTDELRPIVGISLPLLDEFPKGLVRVGSARRTPVQEFRHVHATLADFALVNPRLGAFHPAGQVPLRQLRFLAYSAKQSGDIVPTRWIGLLCHRREASP